MALTTNHSNNEIIKFRKIAAIDFLRSSRFDPYMGEDSTSIIVRMSDLEADGKEIRVPLVNQLSGAGVGSGQLSGSEESVDSYGMPLWADWARNAVKHTKNTLKESSFSIPSVSRNLLRAWSKRIVKEDLTDSLLSIPTASIQSGRGGNPGNRVNGVKWADATATQKNNWMDANSDRVVFGSQLSNYSAGNFGTSVANVDSTNDKLTADVVRLLKATAQNTGYSSAGVLNGKPKITPWMIPDANDEEMYVLFVGQRAMRDLRKDSTMAQANRDARQREGNPEKTNPIFTGGALLWEGVLIKEIPEITQRLLLSGVGASSIDVEPVFLCGQGAYAYVMGQMPAPTGLDDTDYGFLKGFGIEAQYGAGKIAKAPLAGGSLVDWGVVTGFVSGVADA